MAKTSNQYRLLFHLSTPHVADSRALVSRGRLCINSRFVYRFRVGIEAREPFALAWPLGTQYLSDPFSGTVVPLEREWTWPPSST